MNESVSDTMKGDAIHQEWVAAFRNQDCERSTARLLRRAFSHIPLLKGSKVLDAGCGSGTNSHRLAERGFDTTGVDMSAFALERARADVPEVVFEQGDLTDLRFADHSFDAVLCHGVLMHIPDFTAAIGELVRVIRPGGYLVLAESNASSIEMRAFLLHWKRSTRVRVERGQHGIDTWSDTADGPLLSRKFRIPWLVRELQKRNMTLTKRLSSELSELYIYFRSRQAKALIHAINTLWFKVHGSPRLALGNLLIFQKDSEK